MIGRIISGYTNKIDDKVDTIKLQILEKFPKLNFIIKVSRRRKIKIIIDKLFKNIRLHFNPKKDVNK